MAIFWCKNCQVPLLGAYCYLCGDEAEYCASDARFIFEPERRLLESRLLITLPKSILYNARRIIYKGKTYVRFTVKNAKISLRSDRRDEFKETHEQSTGAFIRRTLRANDLYINQLVAESKSFITEMLRKFSNTAKSVTIAFSGGKDSVVVADLVKTISAGYVLFFADTGLELPDTYDFIYETAKTTKVELKTAEPDIDFIEMCRKLEPPSKIMRWCCTLLKANAANKLVTSFGTPVLNFDGIRAAESRSRAKYPRVYDNRKIQGQITARPILYWPTLAVWLYIFREELPFNRAYRNGFSRVGCGICPYNSTYDEIILREFYVNRHNKGKYWHRWQKKWDAFAKIICQFAEENDKCSGREFFEQGYWKKRKPNRRYNITVLRKRVDDYCCYTFLNGIPIHLHEFLKPITDIRLSATTNWFRSCRQNPGVIAGALGGQELLVSGDYDLSLIERQIIRAINCVGCGACTYLCAFGAIKSKNGSIVIDQEMCQKCGKCLDAKYCIALSYKGNRNNIVKIESK